MNYKEYLQQFVGKEGNLGGGGGAAYIFQIGRENAAIIISKLVEVHEDFVIFEQWYVRDRKFYDRIAISLSTLTLEKLPYGQKA